MMKYVSPTVHINYLLHFLCGTSSAARVEVDRKYEFFEHCKYKINKQ